MYLVEKQGTIEFQPTYEQLMAVSGLRSRTTLSKYLKQLQAKKLITIESVYSAKGFRSSNRYRVAECTHLLLDEEEVLQLVTQLAIAWWRHRLR
ncbi:MAG: hypothetical protein ACRC1D_04445 [Culicoidibacterales bacterium]